ncbi:unnamed protein product [Citrullus colocynthis]|uniref:Uncharacterized protein n=1 Tax=Citrullus colocynthis TaxID=252529 RepID=A0ABP0XZG8_9ROSI
MPPLPSDDSLTLFPGSSCRYSLPLREKSPPLFSQVSSPSGFSIFLKNFALFFRCADNYGGSRISLLNVFRVLFCLRTVSFWAWLINDWILVL